MYLFCLILSFYLCPPVLVHLSPLPSLSVSQGWGRAALQLPSSEPEWHHHIAASSLGVPIHHPDHHRQHQQHHLRMHTHTHKHIHLLQEDKREESPHQFCRFARLKKGWRGPQRRGSCWGRQKPLTCALPTIHLNKPRYRQIWWVRLQRENNNIKSRIEERYPPSHTLLHIATSSEENHTSFLS